MNDDVKTKPAHKPVMHTMPVYAWHIAPRRDIGKPANINTRQNSVQSQMAAYRKLKKSDATP